MDIVEDFVEHSYNNSDKPWKSSKTLCLMPKSSEISNFSFFVVFSFVGVV